jgi:protein-disulfide isomerase-like protein with CxxC motif
MALMSSERVPVTFFFDPACPWAWMTSRWMTEVAAHRDLDVTWEVMSLRYLNEDRDIDQGYRDFIAQRQDLSGAVAAAVLRDGPQVVWALYTALGQRVHPGGRRDIDEVIREAVAEVGLAPLTQAEIDAPAAQDLLRTHTKAMIAKVGNDVGTPTIEIDGAAFFGPVVTPAPKGQAGLDLWDGCVLIARTKGFYEIKRSRTDDPIFD